MDGKNVKIGIVGEGRPNRAMESLLMMSAMASTFSTLIEPHPSQKLCKKAKFNKSTWGVKCKHSGSCDGSKRSCKYATY